MRANRPNAGESVECLAAQSKLTSAGDAGANAMCPEAQPTNKISENYLFVPRCATMGLSALDDFFGLDGHLLNKRKHETGNWSLDLQTIMRIIYFQQFQSLG